MGVVGAIVLLVTLFFTSGDYERFLDRYCSRTRSSTASTRATRS